MRKIKSSKIDAPRGVTDGLTQKMRRRRLTLQQIHESDLHAPPRRNDLTPDLKFERVSIDALKPADRRVRRADSAQVQRVMASLSRYGQCVPIVTRKRTIVAGHIVFEAARKIGMTELLIVEVDHLSRNESRSLAITLNRLGERGSWDMDALQLEFEELVALDEDLVVTGFETAEIDMILSSEFEEGAEEEMQALPVPNDDATSRAGDVWKLGDHRLTQGDARDSSCYPRLLGDRRARLLLTDMPYNLPMRLITSSERHSEFACARVRTQ